MDYSEIGVPTFFTRVEAWECDHNQHWNVRQYMRCFQQAGFVAAGLCGSTLPDRMSQHTRFHRELLETAPVEIRSAVLADGDHAGSTVHLMTSNGRLAATALDQPGHGDGLPRINAADVPLALPRGLALRTERESEPPGLPILEHGFVQTKELDHTGNLGLDWLMGRVAAASSGIFGRLGFTPEFTREHKISRMGVETLMTRLRPIPLGMRLRSTVRVASTSRKSVVLRHIFHDADGTRVAETDQSLVTVDMTTRRATELPEFLRVATG